MIKPKQLSLLGLASFALGISPTEFYSRYIGQQPRLTMLARAYVFCSLAWAVMGIVQASAALACCWLRLALLRSYLVSLAHESSSTSRYCKDRAVYLLEQAP